MLDFSVFDSILDGAFIVESDGKIVYCNEPAATFCQSSVRRLTGKVNIADIFTLSELGYLPFTDASPGRTEATPFIETEFKMNKGDRGGRVQVAIRPVGEGNWLFYIRDVSLEDALHSKYRSELNQKERYIGELEDAHKKLEDYSKNLEKIVETRTAELRSLNQTLNAVLNSLGQGFFTFNDQGDCGAVFTKACQTILEKLPTGHKAWDVLATDSDHFRKWSESMFKEFLPFDDLKNLGPNLYPHSEQKYIVLDFFPIRREDETISDVVVVATDKTTEREAQLALEAERHNAAMIVKYTKNKEQFLQFLVSIRRTLKEVRTIAASPMKQSDMKECYRLLHTLEGEAGTFSLMEIRQKSRDSQAVMEPFKTLDILPDADRQKLFQSLDKIEETFRHFLTQNEELFRLPEGEIPRFVEISMDTVTGFSRLLETSGSPKIMQDRYNEMFLKVPIESRLRYFDALARGVAERLGKKVKPMIIEGGDIRIFPDPLQKFFSSLVHVFRNAVDHGLESPEEREWAGKPAEGQVVVKISQTAAGLQISIRDDGKGVDPEVIRNMLKVKVPGRDFSQQSDQEVIQNLFLSGLSSRDEVGEFSGRGVGLDAVREEVLRIGGSIELKSKVGEWTSIEIFIPSSIDSAALRSA